MNRSFLSHLHNESCYPSFRYFIAFVTIFAYLAVIGIVIATLVFEAHSGDATSTAVAHVLEAVAVAVGIVVAVAILREVALMVADIADATISTAASQQEPEEDTDVYMDREDIAALARQHV